MWRGGRLLGPDCADAAATQWEQTDHGIWEVRGAPRHFLYSKLMCWVALDRAVALADQLHAGERAACWGERGRPDPRGDLAPRLEPPPRAFTQTLDGTELDAPTPVIPIVGFLPANDPRVQSTVDVPDRLTDGRGLVYR